MKKYAINGRFTVRNITGQERFAREITMELDELVPMNFVEIIVPKYARKEDIPNYKNIKVVRWGSTKSHFWEQFDFLFYLLLYHCIGINLCTTCPLLKPDINTIHDINQSVNPQFFQSIYSRLSTIWHLMMQYTTFWWGKKILTVSYFSEQEIKRVFKIDEHKILVLGNGWQHINTIDADLRVFKKHPELILHQYFFAASSITPQKNFKWIMEAAVNNPNEIFVIAGRRVKLSNTFDISTPNNLHFIGYVTDGEMKALMQNCKAFIHPAIYEGFGIPPLEALATGARIIVSKTASLPEIFQNSAHYIDPNNAEVDLVNLLKEPVALSSEVLVRYSWKKEAKKLYDLIINLTC